DRRRELVVAHREPRHCAGATDAAAHHRPAERAMGAAEVDDEPAPRPGAFGADRPGRARGRLFRLVARSHPLASATSSCVGPRWPTISHADARHAKATSQTTRD